MAFVIEVVNHLRLTWRLLWDERVRWWHRAIFAVPLVYLLIPFRYDMFADVVPVIGLVDDWLLALLCSYFFVAVCPRRVVRSTRTAILLSNPDSRARERARVDPSFVEMLSAAERLEMYRHPQEPLALALGVAVLIGLSALGGILVSVLLVLLLGLSYVAARITQTRVLSRAVRVDAQGFPKVRACLARCWDRLPYVPVEVFVLPSQRLQAYTFGLDRPYTVVLCSRLLDELSPDELAAVIGHELGHVLFEHTFLSSLMSGMLYRISALTLGWALIFFRWRRFAELTADRVARLAVGELGPPVRALLRLSSEITDEPINVESVLGHAYHGRGRGLYDHWIELLQSRPRLARRIKALGDFDAELLALDVEDWLTTENASGTPKR
jgi:Zn-dependent protease with chaperone function